MKLCVHEYKDRFRGAFVFSVIIVGKVQPRRIASARDIINISQLHFSALSTTMEGCQCSGSRTRPACYKVIPNRTIYNTHEDVSRLIFTRDTASISRP